MCPDNNFNQTRELLGISKIFRKNNIGADLSASDNFYLQYNLYHDYDESNEQFCPDIVKCGIYNFSQQVKEFINAKFNRIVKMLKDQNMFVETLKAKTKSQLIVGTGLFSVYENGMCIEPHLGIPYVPGSTIKGCVREYAELVGKGDLISIFGDENKDDEKDEESHQPGGVVFFDAFPTLADSKKILKVDIITPHYSEYYKSEGEKAPGDYDQPNIIKYVSVNEGVEFLFILASKDGDLLNKSKELLKGALKEHGLGAKLALGYGRFVI